MTTAAIYLRISKDDEQEGLGVGRQRADCLRLCERNGWDVFSPVFQDNDTSAYSRRAKRHAYLAMLDAVAQRRVDVVVAYHQDRLHRQPRELEHFADVIKASGVKVVTVGGGDLDFNTADGIFNARMHGVVAAQYSDHLSENIRRQKKAARKAGTPLGFAAYGWQRVDGRDVVSPPEARIVQEIADRVLAGGQANSLRGIAADLNKRGVPTPFARVMRVAVDRAPERGQKWGTTQVKKLVLRPRNIGLDAVYDKNGRAGTILGKGNWEPILETEVYNRVVALLADPVRTQQYQASRELSLLGGIAICSICGHTVGAFNNKGVPSYRCAGKVPGAVKATDHLGRKREWLDGHVTRVLLAWLSRPDVAASLSPTNAADVREALLLADTLLARLDTATRLWSAGTMSDRQYTIVSEEVGPRLAAAQERCRVITSEPLVTRLAESATVAAEWESLTTIERRDVIKACLVVKLLPASRRGPHSYDERDVVITWKRPAVERSVA